MNPPARLSGLGRLLPFVRPYQGRVLLAAAALLLAAGATLSVPLAFRHLIDAGFGSQQAVDGPFLALFGVAVLLAIATALRFYSVSWLGERVTADLRSAVFSRVLEQDPAFFDDIRSGEVLSRLTTDTALVQTLVGTSVSLGLRNAVLGTGALVMMLITEAMLALMMIGLLAATLIPVIAIGRRVRRLSRASQDRSQMPRLWLAKHWVRSRSCRPSTAGPGRPRGLLQRPSSPSRPPPGESAFARRSLRSPSC